MSAMNYDVVLGIARAASRHRDECGFDELMHSASKRIVKSGLPLERAIDVNEPVVIRDSVRIKQHLDRFSEALIDLFEERSIVFVLGPRRHGSLFTHE